jgi:hypothetical protein
MFTSCENHGFRMTFENGWTISVQWGKGNYCERQSYKTAHLKEPETQVMSGDAEISMWDARGKDLEIEEWSSVRGWLTSDEVAEWLTRVAAFEGDAEEESRNLRVDEAAALWKDEQECIRLENDQSSWWK